MPRPDFRPLFLFLLLLLLVVTPVAAAPNVQVTSVTHTGNTGQNNRDFVTNSSGSVDVTITNSGTDPTTTDTTVNIHLAGGLTYSGTGSSTGATFTCTGTNTSEVTCTSSDVFAAGASATISINVVAPGTTGSDFVNSADIAGGPGQSDAVSFSVVSPVVDLAITSLTHTGNSENNFVTGSTGSVTVAMSNIGTATTIAPTTLIVTLGAGLTYNTFVSSGWFSAANCTGTTTLVCTTTVPIAPGATDSLTFTVTAPATAGSGTNSASLFTSGDSNFANNAATDTVTVVSGATSTPVTPTITPSVTPFPTFPIAPTAIAPTAVPTATLIPPPPTRTPLPRPANAGQAVGPIPRPGVTVVVDRDGVNVRLLPAIGAEVIATVNAGYTTDILARSPDSQWVEVEIGGELGWIGTAVLAIISGDLNSAPVADPRTIPYGGFGNPRAGLTSVTSAITGKLQNSGLRVRGGPGRAFPVLANAPRYTIFSLLGRTANNNWVQVNFEGTLGWVASAFVEFQQGLGSLDALPVDGIVADALPVSEPTGYAYSDTLQLMLSRVELAQPSLDAIRATWTTIALGGRATCGNYPARPSDFNIPNPVLAPFYATLNPLLIDFNNAMANLRRAIDLLIDVCSTPQPAEGLVGQPVVQAALDAINVADAAFVSLRQRLRDLIPAEGPVNNETECLFTFQNRSQIVPRLRVGEVQIAHFNAHDFVLGYCFDAGAGQSLSIQALRITGNVEPRLTISAFDNPTNFIAAGGFTGGELGGSANSLSTTVSPILITQTGQYILILADLDGGGAGQSLNGDVALLLTDVTASGGIAPATLAIDPATGNVIVVPGGPQQPGINLTPGVGLTPGISTPGFSTPVIACPGLTYTCSELSLAEAYACLAAGNTTLDPNGDGIPCNE